MKPQQPTDSGTAREGRRSFNEAAHKLGHIAVGPAPRREERGPSDAFRAATDENRDVVAHASRAVLALGALGVVYGDLGTSPLYTVQTLFSKQYRHTVHPTPVGVYGVTSLVFWALVVVASMKYAGVIMRAHNRGDGGVMALAALIRRKRVARTTLLVALGLLGAGLFLGDGMITPAITVTSAVEGLTVATPGIKNLVVPIALVILIGLFLVQRFGTGAVGWLFGPVLLLWFAVIGVLGASHVVTHPEVFQALSPTWGAKFILDHGYHAWLTLGAVVLCVTGAEALYADRGHFGAGPIRIAWFAVVLPAVMLSYLGQGALVLEHPALSQTSTFNPFFQVAPAWAQLPLVVLATAASVIASQSVISGAFSVCRQAVQLGFLPRVRVVHTSETEGQIFVPMVNWTLMVGVVVLVLVFRSATRLTDLYGMAVTGTFVLDTTLFVAVARSLWKIKVWQLACLAALFWIVELSFFSSNLTKIPHGAWIPLIVGLCLAQIMYTWQMGRELITRRRDQAEGSLQEFLESLCEAAPPGIMRIPGTAIFLAPSKATTPLALRAQVEHYHVFQEKVVIVSLDTVAIPHVDRQDRFTVENVGKGLFKIRHITIHVGYRDRQNIPDQLALARKRGFLERNLDLEHASYFISRMTIKPQNDPGMPRWRKRLFVIMARNSSSPIDHFGLPGNRTVLSGSQIAL
ncbi:MAG TPA: KUP/HAK/KT family potassium transporter [Solirubrobacteraceae bacterium]|nr:KUP/HAK/KT family potassium transporter [Solirubrobacteraceae bacterium]